MKTSPRLATKNKMGTRWCLLTAIASALPALAQTPMPQPMVRSAAATPAAPSKGAEPEMTHPPAALAASTPAFESQQLAQLGGSAVVAAAKPASARGPVAPTVPTSSAQSPALPPASPTSLPVPVSPNGGSLQPCTSVSVDPAMHITLGKSSVMRLSAPIVRMVIGGSAAGRPYSAGSLSGSGALADAANLGPAALQRPGASDGVAQVDVMLLGPTEVFLLGRRPGAMNLVMQSADGRCFVRDLNVAVDPDLLQLKLAELLPGESAIRVRALDGTLVLTGQVSDAVKADEVMSLAQSLGEGRRVVNLLRVNAPQQVMLEVKIAEVSKGVLDRLGIDLTRVARTGEGARIFTGLFGGSPLLLGKTATSNLGVSGRLDLGRGLGLDVGAGKDALSASGGLQGAAGTLLGVDAQTQDALVRVLAEPNIMALSGQSASFLSGGKIYIPVRQGNGSVSLDERQFGVGLKFHPTVLEGGRVNLKLSTEVSELSQTGAMLSTAEGGSSILPTISTRQVDTTVQLGDGQSLAIAGLIRNSLSQSFNRIPGLGDLPVLGALFRSTAFQKDQTELVFVVTPRLVQPLRTAMLPTDVHIEPSRQDALIGGKAEGQTPPPSAPPSESPRSGIAPTLPVRSSSSPTAPGALSSVSTEQEVKP